MASEIAGCVRKSFSAAREKLRSLATVAKTSKACSVHGPHANRRRPRISFPYRMQNNYKFAISGPSPQGLSMATPTPSRVHIFDTTLRDGEQSPGCSMTVPEKVRLAHQLAELGVDVMEAGFPIASAGDFEAVQKVGREVSVKVAALARCTALDVERAAKALDGAKVAPRIHVFLATSDVHLKYKLKKTRAQVLDEAARRSRWRAATSATWSSPPRTAAARRSNT